MRATALALLTAYLGTGRDVVLPQLIVTPAQAERFEAAAAAAGASYVAVVLDVAPEALLPRLHGRQRTPVTDVVSRIIEERGLGRSPLGALAIACAAVGLAGRESDLFRFTVKHSLIFTVMVGILTTVQAYWLTWMIP